MVSDPLCQSNCNVYSDMRSARTWLLITTVMMYHIKSDLAWDSCTFQNSALWAACCIAFGFLHCSRFVAPDWVLFDLSVHLCLAGIVHDYTQWGSPSYTNANGRLKNESILARHKALGSMGTLICPASGRWSSSRASIATWVKWSTQNTWGTFFALGLACPPDDNQ